MNLISDFLQKFLNLEKDNATRLSIISDVIKQNTGIESCRETLEIKGDSIKINCNPVMRNEIFMHKSQIEDSLKSQKIFLRIV